MRIAILVNDPGELTPVMTTTLLGWELARRGHTCLFVGVERLSWGANGPRVRGNVLPASGTAEQALDRSLDATEVVFDLRPGDVLLLRTNAARDPERSALHRAAYAMARIASDQGVVVLNHPDAIERVGTKLYLLELPERIRPRQVVSAELRELLAFAQREPGPIVMKPLWGTRGDGVYKVDVRSEGAEALVEVAVALLDSGPVVAQEYLVDAPAGDTRVLILDGAVINVGGHRAAVRRVPQPGEFRSNVHLGASPAAAVWTPELAEAVATVGSWLMAAGVFLAGADVVGGKLVEVNVAAPGGVMNAEQFEQVDFLGAICDAIERKVGGPARASA